MRVRIDAFISSTGRSEGREAPLINLLVHAFPLVSTRDELHMQCGLRDGFEDKYALFKPKPKPPC